MYIGAWARSIEHYAVLPAQLPVGSSTIRYFLHNEEPEKDSTSQTYGTVHKLYWYNSVFQILWIFKFFDPPDLD